jgi:cytochrome c oxidase cbb3-type subunit II
VVPSREDAAPRRRDERRSRLGCQRRRRLRGARAADGRHPRDDDVGGAATAGDYAYDTPELLGSERNGPDLTNIGARQPSDVWQEIHLYEPRALVAGSIMPAYAWLFTLKDRAAPGDVVVELPPGFAPAGKVVVASAQALDLIAYLKSLKQAPLPAASP